MAESINKILDVETLITTQLKKDYQFNGVDCDVSYSGCNGCGDSPCRCQTINNVKLTNIDVEEIAKCFSVSKDVVLQYCIDRILTIHKIYEEDCWDVNTGRGYYGEEIRSITIKEYSKFIKPLMGLFDCETDVEKIKYVLTEEYGYLLDSLVNCSRASVKTVPIKSIILGANDYYKKITGEKWYENRTLPQIVCTPVDSNRYRIIDGYHRYGTACKIGKNTIKVVVIET